MQLGQQEDVSLDSKNYLSFHDPVVVWLEYFLQEVQNVVAFCVQLMQEHCQQSPRGGTTQCHSTPFF